MGVKVGGEVLGPLLVLRDIASVLAVDIVVSHGVLVLKDSGGFWVGPGVLVVKWWVLVSWFRSDGFWCFGFEVVGLGVLVLKWCVLVSWFRSDGFWGFGFEVVGLGVLVSKWRVLVSWFQSGGSWCLGFEVVGPDVLV
jgi:hypothetical protein